MLKMLRHTLRFYTKNMLLICGVMVFTCVLLASVKHLPYTDKIRSVVPFRTKDYLSTSEEESLIKILPGDAIEMLESSLAEQEDAFGGSDVNVVIVTYMRSGSTFIGDLLQQNPDVFYVYEPLHTLKSLHMIDRKRSADLLTMRRNINYIYREDVFHRLSQDFIHSFLSCDFLDLDFKTLKQAHLYNSKTTQTYSRCIRNSTGVFGILRCLPLMYEVCHKSRVTLAKTIRAKMSVVADMLKTNPKLKIIHLIRDPRGTLMSQARFGTFQYGQLKEFATSFCKNVSDDLKISENVSLVFPKSLQIVRYEDISKKPEYMTQKLYEFIGLEFTSDVKKYVHNITSAGNEHSWELSTSRANSELTSQKWRQAIELDDAMTIDSACAEVYKVMGYLPLNDLSDLRNVNISLLAEPKLKLLK